MAKKLSGKRPRGAGGRGAVEALDADFIQTQLIKLRASRYVKDKTFKAMSIALSLSENTIRAWYAGSVDRTSPDARALIAVGRSYDVNLNWLLLGAGSMTRRKRQGS